VGDHFGVGLGGEHIALGLQLAAQHFVVFDNAVVYHGNVAGDVRVRVGFRRFAVGGPTGVGNTGAARHGVGVYGIGQRLHFAQAAGAGQLAGTIDNGQTGGIVAAVFQSFQAFQQNIGHVTLRHGAYDATHSYAP